ncbi:FAD:protein FMN transferase [Maricurvus nonylphenolicus]|uniref:FAD:protein FMN transferase n=1 Tax=Maricurvus nonylphenolicus TaxID=1008307 RepID=UPI0036F24F7E
MGTTYHITLVNPPSYLGKETLQADIDKLLLDINLQMSTYIIDSELMRLNRAELNKPIKLSAELHEVLKLSQSVYKLSGGAFDISIGPLVELWGFGTSEGQDDLPSENVIEEAKSRLGSDKLRLNSQALIAIKQGNMALDLSAVAKGYGVDRVATLLEANRVTNYLVEIGGEIRLAGISPRQQAWRIGIEHPNALDLTQSVQKAISLTDIAIATSGDYRNYFEVDGKRYSHTIDPRTGWPVTHDTVSVTVLDKSSARADALATAFSVLGAEASLPIANANGIPAFFLIKNAEGYREVSSIDFKPYL